MAGPLTDADIGPALEAQGYKYVSGYGPTAVWQGKDANGNKSNFSQTTLANSLYGDISPYNVTTRANPNQVAGATAGNLPGLIFVDDGKGGGYYAHQSGQRATDQEVQAASQIGVNPHPGTSYSFNSSVSQSLADPAQLQLQRDQLAQSQKQFDATMAQTQTKTAQDLAQAQATQAFLSQKEAFAESQDNKRLANETRQQAFSNQLQIQNLTAQQTQLQSQRDQFNAQMQQNTQKLNADFESHRQDLQAQNNRDLAQFAQNPQDYGKLAAFQLANRGWGQANTAQTTADLTSNESLQPLAGALDQRTQLANEKSPYNFNPLPALGALDLSGLASAATPAVSSQPMNVPGATNVMGQGATVPAGSPNAGSLANTDAGKAAANQALAANFGGTIPSWLQGFADGGMADGAYISGEDGPELNIPLGEGKALVINAEMMKKMKPQDIKKLKMMADGGVFNGGSVTNLDTTDANQFRMDAFTKALGGTPWAAGGLGGLPTSVFASSPGMSPLVTSLLGSLNQQGKGIPIEEYQRQAQILAPSALNSRVVGRSA